MKRIFTILLPVLILFNSCYDDGYYERPPVTNTTNNLRILIDASHDGGVWWFPQSTTSGFNPSLHHQGKRLADLLRSMGFIVDEMASYTLVTDSLLSRYDKVIRAGAYGSYQPGELAAYTNFLQRRSSLLLISEFRNSPTDIDELAERLGIQFRGTHYDSVKHFAPHATTVNATPFYYNAGAIVVNETSNPRINVLGRLTNSTGPVVMGILNHPTSKIYFLGEINGLQTIPQPFTSQLLKWLFN